MPMYEAECRSCGYRYEWFESLPTDQTQSCPRCGGEGERLFSRYSPKIFQPFVTRNILPGGVPIEVKSQGQLSSLCNEHHLVHLDDPKYEPKPFTPPNIHDAFGSKDLPEARAGLEAGACKKEDIPA